MKPDYAKLKKNHYSSDVGYDGGHMDLIESTTSDFLCHSHCYFKCKEVWFWGLS